MGFVKVVKNKSYYKRFQVKFRRRRQAKTDYALRRRLIQQDKRKYNAPKWRLIVRITNRDVICQVASARMTGDIILASAYAHELKRYGLKAGFTNYAACYCTGLLLARRLLKKLGLDQIYKGKRRINGGSFLSRAENYLSKFEDGRIRRPFKCILDIGLRRSTGGANVFGALKGAVDGGLDIPHSNRRFPGFTKGKKGEDEDSFDPAVLRDRIFGQPVADYMRKLQEEDPEKYQKQFSSYIKAGVTADDLENMYHHVHASIKRDPTAAPKKKRDPNAKPRRVNPKKMPLAERKANLARKIAERRMALGQGDVDMKEADPQD